jgi:hypothetical protein
MDFRHALTTSDISGRKLLVFTAKLELGEHRLLMAYYDTDLLESYDAFKVYNDDWFLEQLHHLIKRKSSSNFYIE